MRSCCRIPDWFWAVSAPTFTSALREPERVRWVHRQRTDRRANRWERTSDCGKRISHLRYGKVPSRRCSDANRSELEPLDFFAGGLVNDLAVADGFLEPHGDEVYASRATCRACS